MEVTIKHCGSTLADTYLHLLDASGNRIDYNDDYSGVDKCSSTLHSYLKKVLPAGTYYVVSEGYSQNGIILTSIQGETNISGNTFAKPIVIGSSNISFSYENLQNTADFTNNYTERPSNDVYYKFTLTTTMEVIIKHCGSTLSDTYLHLLDASGNRIAYNDDYSGEDQCSSIYHSYLKKMLAPGIYYVVSEGYSQNGEIKTTIGGEIPQVAYSYDAAGNRTSKYLFTSFVSLRASGLETEKKDDSDTGASLIIEPGNDETIAPANTGITLSPNPTSGPLTVEISGYTEPIRGEIHLFNSEGKNLERLTIIDTLTYLDLSAYPKGIYLLQIQLNEKVVSRKIIKE
jgi:hypothetical protein